MLLHMFYTVASDNTLQAVAKGPVWELTSIMGEIEHDTVAEVTHYEAGVQGALSLLVELAPVSWMCHFDVAPLGIVSVAV